MPFLLALLLFLLGLVLPSPSLASAADPHLEVRGITVSTPTWGYEWGTDSMDRTLDALVETGANWVAIHPYARIHDDGQVSWRPIDPDDPPEWLARPIAAAHARGLKVMIKPHLAYWGSGFSWRGEIDFDDPAARTRFFTSYSNWIEAVARATKDADAFVVGTELDRLVGEEQAWRALIVRVRRVNRGHLTYAANWDGYQRVPFWDALDAIGVQAYFPLLPAGRTPTEERLRAAWQPICAELRRFSALTGKPVVFTELGYDASPHAAVEPWKSGTGAEQVQRDALRVALEVVQAEPSVRGAFLWKWFPGELQRGDFRMSRPDVRAVVRERWK